MMRPNPEMQMAHQLAERTFWTSGVLAEASELSYRNRLCKFIENEESEPIQIFSDEARQGSSRGDWYGEHAGKWLVAASLAFRRTQDQELRSRIEQVVAFLVGQQAPDGYLGTYAEDATCRLTHSEVSKARSWDIWVHAWILQGFLAAFEHAGMDSLIDPAKKIGQLIVDRFGSAPSELLSVGNHAGLSSAVIIEPLAKLSQISGDMTFSAFAEEVVVAMEKRGLAILTGPARDLDASELGTGKAYQICWVLNGLVVLSQVTGKPEYLAAAEGWWKNIADHHLSCLGGPWGGVGTHKEVFNERGFFSPEGFTETCSTASWMALSQKLFLHSGDPKYVAAIELSLHNALLGALDPNGEDWCYFTFPNGRRNNTYYWACCKSSGAMALEEAVGISATKTETGISVNLLQPFESVLQTQNGVITVKLSEVHGDFELEVSPSEASVFELAIRIPAWAIEFEVQMEGEVFETESGAESFRIVREWRPEDRLFFRIKGIPEVLINTYTVDHHGQEVVRKDYAAIQYGPYVYACGLIDGYKKEETLRLARLFPESCLVLSEENAEAGVPAIHYLQPGRHSIVFRPYFQAGGRHDSAWRATWFGVAWQ
jgi:DUF1680 family protein